MSQNALLARCTPALAEQLRPHLSQIDLSRGDIIAETHQRLEKAYFPHSGIISCVVELLGGGAIETGMIGWDGVFGASQALDARISLNHVMVQLPGIASVMDAQRLMEVAEKNPEFRKLVIGYDQYFLAQVQQTAACNAVHRVAARMCRWLLRMRDLAGDDLPVTQEFLAQMMGVRRSSVSEVAAELQQAGMISYARGRIYIENVALIEKYACECHADVQGHYSAIFDGIPD